MSACDKLRLKKRFDKLFLRDEDSGIAEDVDLEDSDESDCIEHENSNLDTNSLEESDNVTSVLPEEIWVKVFSFFNEYELCGIGLTCKKFLRLTRDPGLWSTLTLVGDAIASTECIEMLISRCSQMTEIRITSRDDIFYLVEAISLSCPLLRTLEIKFCPPLLYSDLSKLAGGCKKLEVLNLDGTGCLNGDGDSHEMEGSNKCNCGDSNSFCHLLAEFPHLSDLNLFLARNLHSKGLELIAENCSSLTHLNIDEVNYLSDESVNRLLEVRGAQLKELRIDGESLSDESYANFHLLINLTLLSVSFADYLGPRGLNSITKLSRLEWLKLRRGADLEPESFVFAFKFGCLGNLRHLDLSECSKIDDSGIEAIANHCPKLGTISLNWCWEVTDVGMACLVNKCKYLVTLNLCGVVRLMGDFLRSVTALLPSLKLIDLEQCPDIQLAVLQDLVRKNLDLVVTDYYGERVGPGRHLTEFLLDNPEISFVSYDHESDSDED